MQIDNRLQHRNELDLKKSQQLSVSAHYPQVRHAPVQEAEICLWTAQGQPQDHLQGKLQI